LNAFEKEHRIGALVDLSFYQTGRKICAWAALDLAKADEHLVPGDLEVGTQSYDFSADASNGSDIWSSLCLQSNTIHFIIKFPELRFRS
jgi:hypothetical protein